MQLAGKLMPVDAGGCRWMMLITALLTMLQTFKTSNGSARRHQLFYMV